MQFSPKADPFPPVYSRNANAVLPFLQCEDREGIAVGYADYVTCHSARIS